ncbi:Piwi domain-containing protein [Halopiger xanaduensis]|uniref:Stem cell self-renewal protein Piwi n=1 Tax=Halopiger xanaduensis (strain DSM 18323 / JCM 14033 / SH-6) TaxID=797210 RepID=F8D8G0_HALXS|nr:Piwi domain-containing protein [Halopiger xanaduensis]AEH35583.1 stem cell self-renewal protein Piwi [Halopiger xanaduensis SH-6]
MTNSENTTDSDDADEQRRLHHSPVNGEGTYLMHSRGNKALENLTVKEYKLNVSPGVKQHEDVDRFTASAKYWLDQVHGVPVAQAGNLRVISITNLSRDVEVWGKSVSPEFVRHRTLDPAISEDNDDLKELVQSALRRAIPKDKYSFRFLNDVVRESPAFVAESGKFAAHPTYDLRVRITSDGVPLLHVESGHTLRATTTVDQLIDEGDDPSGMKVEHDTTHYDQRGSGELVGWSDSQYTDHIDDVGNSIYGLHEGDVEEEFREQLKEKDPRLLRIRYGNDTKYQLPHLLLPSPRLEQIEEQDRDFHQRYNEEKGLLPQRRHILASNFVEDLQVLPTVDIEFLPGPTNYGYELTRIRGESPRLVFGGENRHTMPRRGLVDHGVFNSPGQYRVGVLTPATSIFDEIREEFLPLLVRRLREIGAPAAVKNYTFELGDVSTYTEAAHSVDEDTDVVVAVVPDKEQADSLPGMEDPFDELKRSLMRRGIPSQMMMKPTIDELLAINASAGNFSFINALSAIVAKAGGTPWVIGDLPGPTDAFMGLDVTRDENNQHAGASASVVLNNGAVFAAESTTLQSGEKFQADHINQFIRDLVHDFASSHEENIRHVTILRDGKIHEQVDTIREGLSGMDIEFDMVGIRKTGQPRVTTHEDDEFKIADKGLGFVDTDREESILHPWGVPETTQDNQQGTPRTIGIVKDSGPTDLHTITEQVYWLTEMHFGSPARSTREPVPIKYADAAADYVRKGFVAPGEVIHGPAYL